MEGYTVNKWAGHDNFNCIDCQFSSLDEDKMKEHVAAGRHVAAHPPAAEVKE